jgi:hypothetical protein
MVKLLDTIPNRTTVWKVTQPAPSQHSMACKSVTPCPDCAVARRDRGRCGQEGCFQLVLFRRLLVPPTTRSDTMGCLLTPPMTRVAQCPRADTRGCFSRGCLRQPPLKSVAQCPKTRTTFNKLRSDQSAISPTRRALVFVPKIVLCAPRMPSSPCGFVPVAQEDAHASAAAPQTTSSQPVVMIHRESHTGAVSTGASPAPASRMLLRSAWPGGSLIVCRSAHTLVPPAGFAYPRRRPPSRSRPGPWCHQSSC